MAVEGGGVEPAQSLRIHERAVRRRALRGVEIAERGGGTDDGIDDAELVGGQRRTLFSLGRQREAGDDLRQAERFGVIARRRRVRFAGFGARVLSGNNDDVGRRVRASVDDDDDDVGLHHEIAETRQRVAPKQHRGGQASDSRAERELSSAGYHRLEYSPARRAVVDVPSRTPAPLDLK